MLIRYGRLGSVTHGNDELVRVTLVENLCLARPVRGLNGLEAARQLLDRSRPTIREMKARPWRHAAAPARKHHPLVDVLGVGDPLMREQFDAVALLGIRGRQVGEELGGASRGGRREIVDEDALLGGGQLRQFFG